MPIELYSTYTPAFAVSLALERVRMKLKPLPLLPFLQIVQVLSKHSHSTVYLDPPPHFYGIRGASATIEAVITTAVAEPRSATSVVSSGDQVERGRVGEYISA